MGAVLAFQPRLAGKRTQLIMDALEYEASPDSEGEQIIIIAPDQPTKTELRRQLQCMVGVRTTRIEVLTTTEVAARRKIEAERAAKAKK